MAGDKCIAYPAFPNFFYETYVPGTLYSITRKKNTAHPPRTDGFSKADFVDNGETE